MLKAVESTSIKTIGKIKSITTLPVENIGFVKENGSKIYKKKLIELMFEQPYSKIEYVVAKLKVKRKGASRHLRKLEKIGLLKSQKMSKETIFLNEIN